MKKGVVVINFGLRRSNRRNVFGPKLKTVFENMDINSVVVLDPKKELEDVVARHGWKVRK
ncbi:hypothetical protein BBG03_03345 [Streptococcus dysgalactiae subsp. equisimilis]|uniref:hypothetical protein n=1 Tax=Streptococcus dysgalactiae TaxID=1334 RepID=UPI0008070393|nr:hypothetical protein [Streptococcus dysgalactiae]OBZ00630.1 hypothetical protein BBG03_03345 [Streptococcus dysgalactiae subsp. equisimilis]